MFLIGSCYSSIVRTEGKPLNAMMGALIGNGVNIILDPIMILGFGWGIRGAAIATVVGNSIGGLYYIANFLRGKTSLSISPKYFTIKEKVFTSVLSIGVPSALGSVMMSVSQIVVNSLIAGYGDMAVAAYGVTGKVTMVVGVIAIGFGQGIQPLLGFCVGAQNKPRFNGILKFSLISATAVQTVLVGACYVFIRGIINVFLTEASAFDYGVYFSRIMLSTGFLFSAQYVLMNTIQAAGDSLGSFITSLSRQGLIFIPIAVALNAVIGINGLLWAQPAADILSTILVIFLFRRTVKNTFAQRAIHP
jgi:Na+-driven multidrug efflux pump